MRFELTREPLTAYQESRKNIIIWMYKSGSIESTRFMLRHPLTRVYWNICKDNRLQAVKTDIDSRKVALLLITSLVLL